MSRSDSGATWAYRLRLIAAILASSILVPLICFATVIVPDMAHETSFAATEGRTYFALAFFVIGWPLSLITISVFAAAMRTRIRERDPATWKITMVWALALGGIALPGLWRLFWGADSGEFRMALAGALGGLASGATFCLIALRGSPTPALPA